MPEGTYIRLSLNESGMLCHLMMQALLVAGLDPSLPISAYPPNLRHAVSLHRKLARANDFTMGKSADEFSGQGANTR
jgi:hypothetical protein